MKAVKPGRTRAARIKIRRSGEEMPAQDVPLLRNKEAVKTDRITPSRGRHAIEQLQIIHTSGNKRKTNEYWLRDDSPVT